MKKHLALVLALVMVLSSFSFVSAAPDFADVQGTVYEDAVDRLELLNILKGYPDGTFKPENTITRAEFAAVAVRVSGLESVAVAAQGLPTGFTDVPAYHWASGYVGTAAKMGIVNGIGNGLFAPETPVKYEEAITMIVRALGYEPMAQARGGYPFGYLIVANEIDLLEDAMGTQGTWATRGFVAQITDNALEIEMMIQTGYGADTKWVVSGEEDTDEEFLLDRMGFNTVEGRVVDVDDNEIEIDAEDRDDDGWYDVSDTFDFYEVKGAEVKVWLDGDLVILASVQEDVLFDAVEVDGDEITLVGADDDYDLADDAMLFVDGEEMDFEDAEYAYAKVVVNEDGDVIWVDAVEVLEFIVANEMDDAVVYDLNDDELDTEDFLIVEDGKTISVEDLEEGDVVFFLADDYFDYDGFAVVYNESEVGEITRVYSDAEMEFRLDGSTYSWVADALYLDEEDLGDLTADILDGMMDEEEEVEVFFDFNGDVVLVNGNTGIAVTDTFYAVLTGDTVLYDGRSGDMVAFDFLNEFGEEVAYDLEEADLDTVDGERDIENNFDGEYTISANTLFEITVDEDGDVEEIMTLVVEPFADTTEGEGFEIDDTYAQIDGEDFRLMSSTVVFYDSNDEVITLGEIDGEFSEVEAGSAYVKNGRVEVIVSAETDADTDTTDYTGLVTDVRDIRGGEVEITIDVAGEEMVFETEDASSIALIDQVDEDEFWTLVVGDTSGEIDDVLSVNEIVFEVKSVDISAETIELVDAGTFGNADDEIELTSDAMIYDGSDDYAELRLRDVEEGDAISVVFDGTSKYWAIYVVVSPADVVTPPVDEAVVTYINTADGIFMVDDVIYEVGATTVLYNADDEIVAVGKTAVLAALTAGDEIEEVVVEDGVVVSITAATLASEEPAPVDEEVTLENADVNYVSGTKINLDGTLYDITAETELEVVGDALYYGTDIALKLTTDYFVDAVVLGNEVVSMTYDATKLVSFDASFDVDTIYIGSTGTTNVATIDVVAVFADGSELDNTDYTYTVVDGDATTTNDLVGAGTLTVTGGTADTITVTIMDGTEEMATITVDAVEFVAVDTQFVITTDPVVDFQIDLAGTTVNNVVQVQETYNDGTDSPVDTGEYSVQWVGGTPAGLSTSQAGDDTTVAFDETAGVAGTYTLRAVMDGTVVGTIDFEVLAAEEPVVVLDFDTTAEDLTITSDLAIEEYTVEVNGTEVASGLDVSNPTDLAEVTVDFSGITWVVGDTITVELTSTNGGTTTVSIVIE